MGKRVTKAQAAHLARLETTCKEACEAVYAAAHPRRDVVFSECYRMASEQVREAYSTAYGALHSYQNELVRDGRAYWRDPSNFHGFTPN
jgi:superfamily I DNA and RNA helicase